MSATHLCPQISLTKVRPLASLKVTGPKTPELATRVSVPLQIRMDRIQAGASSSKEANIPVRGSHMGRRVETGILESPQSVVISLKFESFPIWLLTLDSMQITKVHLMGISTQEDFESHVKHEGFDQQLIAATLKNVGASKVKFTTNDNPAAGSLYLVSGSKAFVQAWSEQVTNRMLVLCDEHIRTTKRLHCQGTLCWMVLRHSTFGGVTHFRAMVGTNIPGFAPVRTTLKRTIGHVLEHSVKPKWAPAPSKEPATATLRLEDRLHPIDLQREVVYHTHYSSTG